jgi:hypothetical protein
MSKLQPEPNSTFFFTTTVSSPPASCSHPCYCRFHLCSVTQWPVPSCNLPHVDPLVVLVPYLCTCARSFPFVTVLGFCSRPFPLCISSPTSTRMLTLTLPDSFTFALCHVAASTSDPAITIIKPQPGSSHQRAMLHPPSAIRLPPS